MQVVNAVIVVIVLASLLGTIWTFVNKDCVVNASGVCGGVGAVYENNTPYGGGITVILKLLPLFLVIGGLLFAINTYNKGQLHL
jgi:hypothetical protein